VVTFDACSGGAVAIQSCSLLTQRKENCTCTVVSSQRQVRCGFALRRIK